METGESVAIKKAPRAFSSHFSPLEVFQDKRYKNRELQIMKELKHPNVVDLKHAFYTSGDKPGETYLNATHSKGSLIGLLSNELGGHGVLLGHRLSSPEPFWSCRPLSRGDEALYEDEAAPLRVRL